MGYRDDGYKKIVNKAMDDLNYLDDFVSKRDSHLSHPPIRELNLPPIWKGRIIRLLKKANVVYIKELVARSVDELLEIPGMQEEYLDAVEVALNEIGLCLDM